MSRRVGKIGIPIPCLIIPKIDMILSFISSVAQIISKDNFMETLVEHKYLYIIPIVCTPDCRFLSRARVYTIVYIIYIIYTRLYYKPFDVLEVGPSDVN